MSDGKRGRPTIYSDELVAAILERMADGESLRSICADEAMPARSTIFSWIATNETFAKAYAAAREVQADALFDELLDIADDGTNDWMERKNADGQNIGWMENGEALRRSVLRVDTRKWVASKILPKKYGERVTNVVEGGETPVQITGATTAKRRAAAALLLARQPKPE